MKTFMVLLSPNSCHPAGLTLSTHLYYLPPAAPTNRIITSVTCGYFLKHLPPGSAPQRPAQDDASFMKAAVPLSNGTAAFLPCWRIPLTKSWYSATDLSPPV